MARVLILAGDPAESLEVLYPYERLSKKGYEVHKGARVPVGGSVHGGVAGTFEARWGIARLTHDSYAAIIAQQDGACLAAFPPVAPHLGRPSRRGWSQAHPGPSSRCSASHAAAAHRCAPRACDPP